MAEPTDPWVSLMQPAWLASLDRTRFLRGCRQGVVGRAELHSFVRQQHHYSQHFPRYLNALMANILDADDRRDLMANLLDEMGLDASNQVSHRELYFEMMRSLGLSPEEERPTTATDALVGTMFECCACPRVMVGLGALCLGAEAIVPHVYAQVLAAFESLGEPRQNLRFFVIHVENDEEHAQTMRRIILRELERQPAGRLDLDYGAARVIAARAAFFEAIGGPADAERAIA